MERVILVSGDGLRLETSRAAACVSEEIKNALDASEGEAPREGAPPEVPLPNVSGAVLAKVMQFCGHCAEHPSESGSERAAWARGFLAVDHLTQFELLHAANYLNIKQLLASAADCVASAVRNKTEDQLRQAFDVEGDFTPEEREEIRRENAWALEDGR
jgi:S-phase kinase-associated protein 1